MSDGPEHDDRILLKDSGRSARLEITEEDLAPTQRLPVVEAPAGVPVAARQPTAPADDDVQVELRGPRPLPGGRGGPPGGGPPTRYVHDAPTPWWRTRAATWGAAALLAFAVLATVLVLVLAGGQSSEEIVYEELATTHTEVTAVMQDASEATRITALREAGRAAEDALVELQDPEATIRQVDDAQVRAAALGLLAAERQYLEALQQLTKVDRAMVSARSRAAWSSIRRRIENRQQEVVEATAAVRRVRFESAVDTVVIANSAMTGALQGIDGTVTKAYDAFASYRRELAAWRRAVGRARGKEREINAYRSQVQEALGAYEGDRSEVDDFVEGADQVTPGDGAVRAQNVVDGFYQARDRTVSQLSTALSAAPESVRSAHKNLQDPLEESLRGLSSLRDAINEYATDPYGEVYGSVTETPGWQEFQEASGAATSELDSARAQWNAAVQAAIKDVKDRGGIPPRPGAPRV